MQERYGKAKAAVHNLLPDTDKFSAYRSARPHRRLARIHKKTGNAATPGLTCLLCDIL